MPRHAQNVTADSLICRYAHISDALLIAPMAMRYVLPRAVRNAASELRRRCMREFEQKDIL